MEQIKLYENKEIRSVWDNEKEEWYFSVVDVVGVLSDYSIHTVAQSGTV